MVRGRPVACLRCQSTTHLRRECDAIRCDRCRRWGRHLPADCPTPASWATRSAPEVVVVDVELVDEDADGRPHGASISPPDDATVVAMDIIGSVSRAVSPGTAGAVPAPTGAADVGSTVVSGPPLRRADTTSGHTATALSVTGVVLKESAPPVPSSYTGRLAGPSLSSVGGGGVSPPTRCCCCRAVRCTVDVCRRRRHAPAPPHRLKWFLCPAFCRQAEMHSVVMLTGDENVQAPNRLTAPAAAMESLRKMPCQTPMRVTSTCGCGRRHRRSTATPVPTSTCLWRRPERRPRLGSGGHAKRWRKAREWRG